ncbi:hypothetical protein [Bacillus sp. Hm123]|uniref:hypothetical protein n=1 Tax=Bacillus sp. Hm123 TaxID=3450745 RepID=UPI003F434BD2
METEVNEQVETEVHREPDKTVSKEDYDSLVAELEEVKGKLPVVKSEAELAIEAKQVELFQKEVALTLKENNLEQFTTVIKVNDSDELNTTIEALNKIVNEIKVSAGYVPVDHMKDDVYNAAKNKGDTKTMIKSLFGLN